MESFLGKITGSRCFKKGLYGRNFQPKFFKRAFSKNTLGWLLLNSANINLGYSITATVKCWSENNLNKMISENIPVLSPQCVFIYRLPFRVVVFPPISVGELMKGDTVAYIELFQLQKTSLYILTKKYFSNKNQQQSDQN